MSNAINSQTINATLTEKEKIEFLITSVENLENAKFYRNGSIHDAVDAGKHLRMKVRKAGDRVKTAEDFIEKLASKSSITGKDYKIVFLDGKEQITSKYFHSVLNTLK